MRALHFSDIHCSAPLAEVPLLAWPGKRLVGATNHVLGRGRRFREARRKVEALEPFAREHGVELVLCTGDYTVLGSDAELAAARAAVSAVVAGRTFLTVPGNHDLYVPDTVRRGLFERHFPEAAASDLPEHGLDDGWPRVRLLGGGVAAIALASAEPRWQPWQAGGRVSERQLLGLSAALADPRVAERFVFVLVHHGLRRPDGSEDSRHHRLENADALLRACAPMRRGALLHGHIHRCFRLRLPGAPAPIFGAGSATYAGREGCWLFEVGADGGSAVRGRWDGGRWILDGREHHPV